MSTNTSRRPSVASQTIITGIVILVILSGSVLFLYLQNRKNAELKKPAEQTQQEAPAPQPAVTEKGTAEALPWTSNPAEASSKKIPPPKIHAVDGVNPPLPVLDLPQQQFVVNAGTGQIITSRRNSRITIPPSAFVDKDGNVLQGDVVVNYREFYNYMDFFLSGIPMKYDSGKAGMQLESAGMMELTASRNNEEVFVNRQNRISVMMASLNKSPDYNLYYFDKKQNKWIYKGKDMLTVSQFTPQTFILQPIEYRDSVETVFSFKAPQYTIRLYSAMEPAGKKRFFFSKKPGPDKFSFHFIASLSNIPELNNLRTFTWKYTGNDAAEVHKAVFRSGIKWKDIQIHPMDTDETYLLTMYTDTGSVNLKILPHLATENSRMKFKTRFDEFLVAQDERRATEKANFEKFKNDTTLYFANNPRWVKFKMPADYAVMRQFQVDGFGIWNCDRPVELPKAVTVFAYFVDEKNKPVKPERVFLADKNVNTVFSYNSYTLNDFKFNPKSQNLVWALFPGNVIAVIKPKEFSEKYAKAKEVCKFKVEMIKNAALTETELKKQLAFDL